MESLYARDTPTAQERKLKLAKREQAAVGQTDAAKQQEASRQEQHAEALAGLMDAATEASPNTATDSGAAATTDATANAADDFGFNFASLPSEDAQQQLEGQWRSSQDADPGVEDGKAQQKSQAEDKKTEGHLAELSGEPTASSTLSAEAEKVETKKTESNAPASAATPAEQPRRAGVASVPRKPKPAITINTGSGSTGIGAKRPPPTPVSPPTFSWNDILRVQNLIERCLQQYLSKNDILITLKEQANVDPAFSNVVWQKLEEQNPTFFRAYSLQLQLKEQIIAFNYLVGQQKEMVAKGGKRLLHYSNINRASASRTSAPCSLITTPTTTTLPPISMDARTFLKTPIRSSKQQRTPAGKRAYNQHMNMYQLGSPSVGLGATSSGMTSLPPPSPLPLPSPIKTDLDTHAFFT